MNAPPTRPFRCSVRAVLGLGSLIAALACGDNGGPAASDTAERALTAAPDAPNIVLIVADDLPYERLGHVGYTRAATPNIDAIASQGTWFSHAYVSAPVCAPARAGLMTGRYPARFGYEVRTGTVPEQIRNDLGVDVSEIFLPELLRGVGYRSAAIGKWHLGYNPKYRPLRRGFDHFFGYLAGHHDYFVWDIPESERSGGSILRGDEAAEGSGYITEAFTREAVDFIRDHAKSEERFFLYLAYPNVHGPILVPDHYRPPGGDDLDASLQALDVGVGAVLEALEHSGIEDETLVVFLNDNGGKDDNGPFRGRKTELSEGGVRVAFAMRWPGRIAAGNFDPPVIQLDLLPTLAAAAGAPLPSDRPIDGVDLLPFLRGERSGEPHSDLFWRYPPRGRALRSEDWKLFVDNDGGERLYDLSSDPREQFDIAATQPERVRSMRARLDDWEVEMDGSVAPGATDGGQP